MRNIPDFTCDYGAATLVLQEVPRRREGYCILQWVAPAGLEGLVEECVRFCRMTGAERVYVSGEELPGEPAFRIVRMTAPLGGFPKTDALLWPLLPENWEVFRSVYNQAMEKVPAAKSLQEPDRERLLTQGGCYFVHRAGALLGLGQVDGNRIEALVSCIPGQGRHVAAALATVLQGESVTLQVADTNHRAVALYDKLGFIATGVAETWWEF